MSACGFDFETKAISDIPDGIPPEPVGLALRPSRGKAQYWAWGHPTGNNCTKAHAKRMLKKAITEHDVMVAYNSSFDQSIGEYHMGARFTIVHDAMVLCFLDDPYAFSLELKPTAKRVLGIEPDERDAVRQWLIDQGIVKKNATKAWGASICKAPGDIVGPYAIGDAERTYLLYRHYKHLIPTPAFQREVRLAPVLADMQTKGVPIDVPGLERDTIKYEKLFATTEDYIRKTLKRPSLDIGSGAELADAIESAYGAVLPLTPTGRRSTAKDTITEYVPDTHLRAALLYRSSLRYALSTYMRPWVIAGRATGGTVHPHWNATRGDDGGARTSRLSSSPNLQNLRSYVKEMELLALLKHLWRKKWELPFIRAFVQAPKGKVFVGRDYSQIELRLTAFYEQGIMYDGYIANPTWDLHQWVIDTVFEMFGIRIPNRTIAKNVGFGIIYGAGAVPISIQAKISLEQAAEFKSAYLKAIPTLRTLMDEVQDRGKMGGFITTLGDRIIKAQPPAMINGVLRAFFYKLLNYLIQGSAAEMMKESMIAYYESKRESDYLVMSVHDEPVALSDDAHATRAMQRLFASMHAGNPLVGRIDVPILSEGYIGANWANTKEVA